MPFSTPGDLPNPGIELASPALAGGFFTTVPPGKPNNHSRDVPGGIVHKNLLANAGNMVCSLVREHSTSRGATELMCHDYRARNVKPEVSGCPLRQLGRDLAATHWSSESESRSVMSDSLQPRGLYNPWNSPGQNTGVGSLFLLQGIFPTQGSNPGLPHYQLGPRGSPIITSRHLFFWSQLAKYNHRLETAPQVSS